MSTGKQVVARLFGGPMSGRTMTVPAGTEKIKVVFWTYEYAGREGSEVCFAKRLNSRPKRRIVQQMIVSLGKHPAVEFEHHKPKPHVSRTDKRKQGRERRARQRMLREASLAS